MDVLIMENSKYKIRKQKSIEMLNMVHLTMKNLLEKSLRLIKIQNRI